MSLRKHAEYKESGLPLTPIAPSHWSRTALKYLGNYQNGYPFKPEDRGEEGLPIIRISQLTSDDEPAYFKGELDQRVKVATGDLLFSWSATIDAYIWSRGDAWLNQHIFKVTESQEASKDFLYYVIKHIAPKLADFDAHGSTMRHIKKESLGEKLYIPPQQEQLAIANFLDHETAKIDALIAEQQRLIELLQEKRQVVISHAVTKGLNPNAPMKDSGVEWLGEVPEHWSIKQIKHLCISIEQGWSPQCENEPSEGDAPGVLKVGCVNGGLFRPSENKKLPPELAPVPQYSVKIGDLLVSRANTKELVGSVAVAAEDFPWLYICDKLYRITIKPQSSSSKYLALYLASREARGQIELGASGASPSMQNISQSVLLDMSIPVPQLDEQESIRNDITIQCDQIDQLTAKVMEAIRLFQERRSALISAAVTGQIDVRGLTEEVAA